MQNSNNPEYYINSSFGNIAFYRGILNTQSFKPHFHETYTIILVDQGIGDYSTSKSNYTISKNKILVFNPYEVHTGKPIDGKPWSFLTFHIPLEIMKKVTQNELIIPFFENNKIEDDNLFKEGFELFPYLLSPENFTTSEKVLIDFLKNLYNNYSHNNQKKKLTCEKKVIAKKIRQHIHNSLDGELSLNFISKEFNLSVFSLIKIFKDSYDLPPHQYVVNLKIEKAKKMLLKNRSCTEVAYDAGFFDQSHFIRHFKKIVGVTPKKYTNIIR